jgi:catechol 2,3-dioxygenase-like lactoylglutathione lyase family enzyme
MLIESIDHIIVATPDVPAAAVPFERLGLTLTPGLRHASGTHNRSMFVGNTEVEFYVELLGVYDAEKAQLNNPGWGAQTRAMEAGGAVVRLMLGIADVDALMKTLQADGVEALAMEVRREDGSKICDVVRGSLGEKAGCEISFVRYEGDVASRRVRHAAEGLYTHAFPLKRLDHLAVFTPTLEATTRFWVDVLGVPVFGEVKRPGVMIIRQMKIGDAIVELLGPDGPDSPMNNRPAGMASMAAFEVANLDVAVSEARARGFTVPDGAVGILPGTRVATIPAAEMGGIGLQLLEYV